MKKKLGKNNLIDTREIPLSNISLFKKKKQVIYVGVIFSTPTLNVVYMLLFIKTV